MKKLSGFLIVVLFAMLTVAAWGYANRPTTEPELPRVVHGFAFQPYQKDQDAIAGEDPTVEQIDADLRLLAGTTRAVRTYSSIGTLGEIPGLARKHGLKVMLGTWLDADRERNAREIEASIRLANQHRNVTRILVGNEVVLRGDLPLADLTAHLDHVRAATRQPVSTAEPWHVWIRYPELAEHVDFITVHMLPYWEGVEVEAAVGYVGEKLAEVQKAFPGKPIVIGEVGWPSEGRTRE
jgi:exo-beta-1,3-glucanase (GH17 family)